jgi:hypothetical protein
MQRPCSVVIQSWFMSGPTMGWHEATSNMLQELTVQVEHVSSVLLPQPFLQNVTHEKRSLQSMEH